MPQTYNQGPVHPAVSEAQIDIAVLQSRYAEMERRLEHIEKSLANVERMLTEAKGGWRVMMILGGGAATLGGLLTWFFTHSITVGP